MDLARRSAHTRICHLSDYGVDPTGATNEAAKLQKWQDDALANKFVAVAPAGIFASASQLIFKAPTYGAGGRRYGVPLSGTIPLGTSTVFKNTGVNTSIPFIVVPAKTSAQYGQAAAYFYYNHWFEGFIVDGGGLNCLGMWSEGSILAGGDNGALDKWTIRDVLWLNSLIGADLYGWQGVIDSCGAWGNTVDNLRLYIPNATVVRAGWYYGNANTFAISVFGNRLPTVSGYEGASCVSFEDLVVQSRGTEKATANGIRISERVKSVVFRNVYFENFYGDTSTEKYSLDVGSVGYCTNVNVGAGDYIGTVGAAANTDNEAVKGVSFHGGVSSSYDGTGVSGTSKGTVFRFGNVLDVEFDAACKIQPRRLEISARARVHNTPVPSAFSVYEDANITHTYPPLLCGIVDKSHRVGRRAENLVVCPDFDGSVANGLRGFSRAFTAASTKVNSSLETTITRNGRCALRVTRVGDGTNDLSGGYPWLWATVPGATVLADRRYMYSAWIYVPASPSGYASNNFTDRTTFSVPQFGLVAVDLGTGNVSSVGVPLGYQTSGHKSANRDEWVQVWGLVTWKAAFAGRALGFFIKPNFDEYTVNDDHWCIVSDVGIFFDPPNPQAILAGDWQPASTHASFRGGIVEMYGTAPPNGSETYTNRRYFKQGDRMIHTAPVDGGNEGWVCTVSGSPAGTWRQYGVIGED